jgi:hypothetical protein
MSTQAMLSAERAFGKRGAHFEDAANEHEIQMDPLPEAQRGMRRGSGSGTGGADRAVPSAGEARAPAVVGPERSPGKEIVSPVAVWRSITTSMCVRALRADPLRRPAMRSHRRRRRARGLHVRRRARRKEKPAFHISFDPHAEEGESKCHCECRGKFTWCALMTATVVVGVVVLVLLQGSSGSHAPHFDQSPVNIVTSKVVVTPDLVPLHVFLAEDVT